MIVELIFYFGTPICLYLTFLLLRAHAADRKKNEIAAQADRIVSRTTSDQGRQAFDSWIQITGNKTYQLATGLDQRGHSMNYEGFVREGVFIQQRRPNISHTRIDWARKRRTPRRAS